MTGMLARLQRFWVFTLVSLAAATAAITWRAGWPPWASAVAAMLVLGVHALALALEFLCLRCVSPGAGVSRPSLAALIPAWWGEVKSALIVFGWRQPFRSTVFADSTAATAASRRGVLLVHGFVCNRGLWNAWMVRLRASGTPYVAVNLEPVFGSIDRYVGVLDDAIHRLERATGLQPVVVAHSMGGLAVRAWLRDHNGDRRLHSVVTIGTPHAGTELARVALTPNGRQMRPGSAWLNRLAGAESGARRSLFTCYFGHCDNIVFPAANGTLPDATNRHVPGIAHVQLVAHEPIFDDVLNRTRS